MSLIKTGRRCAAAFAAIVMACSARAQMPIFTVDPIGPSGLSGAGIYSSAGGAPVLVGGNGGMGLTDPLDDLNALSRRHTTNRFIVCVSVDPSSAGEQPAGPPALGLPPFNAWDQSNKNQQAGDVYRTSEAYDRATGLDPGASMGVNENYLIVNQGDQYVQDFGLQPAVDPTMTVPNGTPQDNVDGLIRGTGLLRALPGLYFSLTASSPSLGAGSAADIFYDSAPAAGGGEGLFAGFADLGLAALDSIDGLMVFDDNGDGLYNGTDTVLFSLTKISPSLGALSGADILKAQFGVPGFSLFASHSDYGLLATDDIDALEEVELVNNSAYETLLLDVPAPGTLPLLALGAAVAYRRRRQQ